MTDEQLLAWRPGVGFHPETDAGPSALLLADSWLLQRGTVRGWDLHRARFASGCAAVAGIDSAEVELFWRDLRSRLPREGEWFPRVELVRGATAPRLRLRPAPPRTDEVVLFLSDRPDDRTAPRRKGPDLERLGALRRRAQQVGANEALLTTPAGFVLEAATSSLLWWEGDRLCVPDPHWRVLPSVTATLVRRRAEEYGIEVRRSRRRVSELAGREVWMVNALHGIRPVVGWVGADVAVGEPVRAPAWRRWWRDSAEPLDGVP